MKINKEKLREALAIVKPGLATKELLSQTTSFAFMEGRVITYNDEISISHPVEGIDFDGAIKAEELYGLLSKLTNESVEIEAEGAELKIKAGRVKAGLMLEKEINLPIRKVPSDWKKIKESTKFQEFMKLAGQTCSRDMSQPKLVNVFVDGKKIIGSDGQRLIECELESKIPVAPFLIPATDVSELIKINPTQIQLDGDWVHFKNEIETVFSCRKINDSYVAQNLIDDVLFINKKVLIKTPGNILETLSRVMSFSRRDFALDEIVEISIKEGRMFFEAESENTKSWIKENMKIKCDVDFSFTITPSLFIDILKRVQEFTLDKSLTKVKFTVKDQWSYIIMLRKA